MQKASPSLRTSVQVVWKAREVATMTSAWSPTALTPAPRRRAASSRFLTSAVGFLAPGSSVSPDRLTQITGTFAFTHGSTS